MGVAEQSVTAEGRRAKHPPVPGQGRVRRRRPGSVLAPMLVAGLLAGLAAYTGVPGRSSLAATATR